MISESVLKTVFYVMFFVSFFLSAGNVLLILYLMKLLSHARIEQCLEVTLIDG
jgi:hypothetical protein